MGRRKASLIILVIMAVILLLVFLCLPKIAKVPAGYKAKVACSEIFLADRNVEDVLQTNFENISPAFNWVNLKADLTHKKVTGKFLGFGKSVAIYREDVGCSLKGKNGLFASPRPRSLNQNPHSYKIEIKPQVQESIQSLFHNSETDNPIHTRAVVVIKNGVLIAEDYAHGFTKDTRQQSWSTAKGFMQALIGIAVKQGHLSLEDKNLLAAWKDDRRNQISIGHLLHMASGLRFSEAYANPNSHVDQMLFNQENMGAYAASQKLIHPPGTVSIYSSGTTNILSNILRNKLEAANVDYYDFPYKELFDKISMSSAIFELDAAGYFIGSSYIYATPRDFAKFGQLYLQDGVWDNEQILPEGWVDYTGTPAPEADGKYGSHWSLNIDQKVLPGLPEDVIHLGGNDGQMIVVIPSKSAVIVRLGVTRYPATLEADLYPLIRGIYESL